MVHAYTFTKSGDIFLNINCYILINSNINILNFMNKDFEQISLKPGFMKHNGGLLFKTISENEYQFKTKIKENTHKNYCKNACISAWSIKSKIHF